MKFGACLLSVVPVRSEPSDKAEMTTQLLFGDLVAVTESWNNWLKIRIVYDNYEGWIDNKQVVEIKGEEFLKLSKAPCQFTKDLVEVFQGESGRLIPVLFGSTVHNLTPEGFQVAGHHFMFEGHLSELAGQPSVNSIIEDAMLLLNAPYLWGGKTPFGVDCSGFTQTVFKVNGVELLRDAAQQASQGESISLVDEAEPGDLAFFDNEEEKIVHVGIICEKHKIIHASGKVRIDMIDHQGIYNKELQKYTHRLRLIKRLI